MNTHYYFRLYCNLNVSSFFYFARFYIFNWICRQNWRKSKFWIQFFKFWASIEKKSDIENQLKWTEMNHTSKWISLPWQLHDITKLVTTNNKQVSKFDQYWLFIRIHCIKSVQIRSFFLSEHRKIRTRKNSIFGY